MRVLVVALVLACTMSPALADDKPWAAGVSEQAQKDALDLYRVANGLFEQAQFAKALAIFEQALGFWRHPAIYYNAAVCLKNLDRPVEAYKYFGEALKYGDAALDRSLYEQGVKYRDELAGRVGEIEVVCNEPGAEVSLDGKLLFKAPGRATVLVTAAEPHQVVAKKDGFETETSSLIPVTSLAQNAQNRPIEMRMKVSDAGKWKPWVAVAAGALTAAGGGVLLGKAFNDMEAHNIAVITTCSFEEPCRNGEADLGNAARLDDRARWETLGAYTLLAVGTATVATGAWWLMKMRRTPTATPVIGAESAGVAVSLAW